MSVYNVRPFVFHSLKTTKEFNNIRHASNVLKNIRCQLYQYGNRTLLVTLRKLKNT